MGSSLSKLALSAGSRGAIEYGLAEEGMQTTTCSGCKHRELGLDAV